MFLSGHFQQLLLCSSLGKSSQFEVGRTVFFLSGEVWWVVLEVYSVVRTFIEQLCRVFEIGRFRHVFVVFWSWRGGRYVCSCDLDLGRMYSPGMLNL